jgi:hypothetical protein
MAMLDGALHHVSGEGSGIHSAASRGSGTG